MEFAGSNFCTHLGGPPARRSHTNHRRPSGRYGWVHEELEHGPFYGHVKISTSKEKFWEGPRQSSSSLEQPTQSQDNLNLSHDIAFQHRILQKTYNNKYAQRSSTTGIFQSLTPATIRRLRLFREDESSPTSDI